MPSVRTDSQPINVARRVAIDDRERDRRSTTASSRLIVGRAAGAEDRDHVAGDAGDRHLRERHHAAVAAEEGERQRDQAERERLRADLEREERRRDEREQQHEGADEHVARRRACATGTRSQRGGAAGVGVRRGDRLRGRVAACRQRLHRRRRAGVHRSRHCAALIGASTALRAVAQGSAPWERPGSAHAGLPMIPRGRNASTSTRITNVNTTL